MLTCLVCITLSIVSHIIFSNGHNGISANQDTSICKPFGTECDESKTDVDHEYCEGMTCVRTYIYSSIDDKPLCIYPTLAVVPSSISFECAIQYAKLDATNTADSVQIECSHNPKYNLLFGGGFRNIRIEDLSTTVFQSYPTDTSKWKVFKTHSSIWMLF